MTPEQIQEHLADIGQRFMDVAPAGWYHLVGNWEASPDPSGVRLNYLTLAVVDLGDRWGFGQIEFDEPLYDAVAEFALAARTPPFSGSGPWTVLDLEINNEGQFVSNFGFDEPKRTTGVMDAESIGRFENYLETWIAEHGSVPPRGARQPTRRTPGTRTPSSPYAGSPHRGRQDVSSFGHGGDPGRRALPAGDQTFSPDVERACRTYLEAAGAEVADPDWVRLVVLAVKLRFVGEDRPPRMQITPVLIRWDGERAAYSNADTRHDSYKLDAVVDQLDAESIPFTELFMTLDRDGVLRVQVDDLEMLTTDAPLMHPHWDRAIEHLDVCVEDVAAMLERLRAARALPGQKRGDLLAYFKRK